MMGMFKREYFIIIALFIFSSLSLAIDFDVEVDYPTQIFAGGHDFVKITVTNMGNDRWFTVSEFSVPEVSDWFVKKDITYKLKSGESRDFIFEISVPKEMEPTSYGYSFIVRSGDQIIEKKLSTEIIKRTFSGIISDIKLSCKKCKESVNVSATVKNVGSGTLSNIDLIFEVSDEKRKVAIGPLGPNEAVEKSATFSLNDLKPGKYMVTVQMYIDGKISDKTSSLFTVPIYRNVEQTKKITPTPIGMFVTLKAINKGNTIDKAIFQDTIENKWWISYLGPAPEKKQTNGWTWFATLLPNEEEEVSYVLLYWPVPILIVLLISGAVIGYLHLTGVHINKVVRKSKDEVRVSLRVRNLIGTLEGCVIRDTIPNSFILPREFGTLKPIIRKTAHGTELLWRIGNMRPGEERIVNYTIIPRHTHKHRVALPVAIVKGVKNEKQVLSVSNHPPVIELGYEKRKLKLAVAE